MENKAKYTADRGRRERSDTRKEKLRVTMANLIPDDTDKRTTTSHVILYELLPLLFGEHDDMTNVSLNFT